MSKSSFTFRTEAEAEAFRQGIEYVNDSSLQVIEIVEDRHGWHVSIRDEDGADDEES